MKKLSIILMCIILLMPTLAFAKAARIWATALNGGGTGALDAVECEDIMGDGTNRAIATGDVAEVVTSAGMHYIYRYNAAGTDDEDAVAYTIIVPDDRLADCSSQGQWELAEYNGLVIGTNVQAYSAMLAALASYTDPNVNRLIYWNDAGGAFQSYVPPAYRIVYFGTSSALTELQLGPQYSLLQSGGESASLSFTNTLNFSTFIIPNSATPSQTTNGSAVWDSNDFKLTVGDGTNTVAVATKTKRIFELCIQNPTTSHDDIKVKLPNAVTLTAVYGICVGGTSVIGTLTEVSSDGIDTGGDDVAVDGAWTIGTTQFTDTSFTNPGLAAGSWLQWDTTTVNGVVTMFCITAWGYEG